MKDVNAPNCESELIGFLYGEMDAAETPAFERHLHQCAKCSAELAGFKSVRQSVVSWRNESLSFAPAALTNAQPVLTDERKPSAMAALREFFNLSPLWMKGAMAFATIALCLLAGLTVVRMQSQGRRGVVNNGYTKEQVDQMIAQRLQEERDRSAKELQPRPDSRVIVKDSNEQKPRSQTPHLQTMAKQRQPAYAKRPLSRTEREQLAADLRLSSSSDGDIDLLSDSINQ